jgi:hypothetical protein
VNLTERHRWAERIAAAILVLYAVAVVVGVYTGDWRPIALVVLALLTAVAAT